MPALVEDLLTVTLRWTCVVGGMLVIMIFLKIILTGSGEMQGTGLCSALFKDKDKDPTFALKGGR